MKRHISIFAFLLGAFAAAVVQAAADKQTVYGGHYFVEHGPGGAFSSQRMRLKDERSKCYIEIQEGGMATFVAYPETGLEVTQWGSFTLGKGDHQPSDANKYAKYTWSDPKPDSKNLKDWNAKPADGDGYLAVNFDYIPLIVKTNGHIFVEEKIGINKEMTLPVLSKEGYTGKWKNEKGDTFEFGAEVSGADFWYEADGDQERDFYANLTADWTPKEVHPVPDPDEDFVTISSAAVSDGKFALSFPSDARFDYNLLTNANLLINSWGIMETLVGDGKVLTFEPKITEGQPQLFYKVETIQKR